MQEGRNKDKVMASTRTEVVIVGAGPTGLSLACQLTRYGVDFVLCDRQEGITPYSKAIGVQARTLEIYEQIGLAENLIAQGTRSQKVCLIEGGKPRAIIELSDLGQGMSPYPFLLIVEQSKHERLLYDFLTAQGNDVQWQTELAEFSQDAEGVRAQFKTAEGDTQTIEAQYLVGCDGAKSLVRHALNIPFEGSTFERLFYVADVQMESELSHDALSVCLTPKAPTAFFPMIGDNRYRIVGTFPEGFSKDAGEIAYAEIEQELVKDTQLKLDVTAVNWFSVYKVHSRRVTRFSQDRCFLAGDAAHIHTPAGAQGMNTGIQDGYNLAWKLAAVLRGQAGARLLDTYNEERLENAEHLLKTTDRFFDFGASDNPVQTYFRLHILPHVANTLIHLNVVKQFIFPLVSQIGINYNTDALSDHHDDKAFAVKAGTRMPYFTSEGVSIYDKLHHACWHLLIFSDARKDYSELQAEVERQYTGWLDVILLPLEPAATEIFGSRDSFCVLLRPDNYIGFLSPHISLSSLQMYLSRFATPSGQNQTPAA